MLTPRLVAKIESEEPTMRLAVLAHLGTFGSYLTKLQPDFDARLFGFKKLSELVKAKKDIFSCEERKVPGTNTKVLYVRIKQ